MNAVEHHYLDSSTLYSETGNLGGALALIYAVDDGVKVEAERQNRRVSGNTIEGDYTPRDL